MGDAGSDAGKSDRTSELLHEATQLLKTLRVPTTASPKLNVMQIGGLTPAENEMVLIDSGATHALRPAGDLDEWQKSPQVTVQLAEGSTNTLRLKPRTKILLGEPTSTTWIIPMGGLADLDFTLIWGDNQCILKDDEGRTIDVTVVNGCPMITQAEGRRLLQWLELFQVHQKRKMAMVQTMMINPENVDKSQMDLELAMTLKMRQMFPDLPEEILMKVVPRLESMKSVGFLLRFGATAYALRKSWQARYVAWRDVREEVRVLGPDMNSSLTNTGYFVESKATGRRFYTDDIVIPEPQQPALEEQVLYLPERPAAVPLRRQRVKASTPAISMLHMEGENIITNQFSEMFEPDPSYENSSDSWTLGTTDESSASSSPRIPIDPEEDIGGQVEGMWRGCQIPGMVAHAQEPRRQAKAPELQFCAGSTAMSLSISRRR